MGELSRVEELSVEADVVAQAEGEGMMLWDMLQPLVSVDGQCFEWPSWSVDGCRELLGEFEFGYDSVQWDAAGTFGEDW